jgi:phosphotransferase family enzyme
MISWLDGRLADRGITRTGPVRVTRERAWGTVRTAPTTAGPVWLKAPGPDTVFEVALYELLGSVVPDQVPEPLAVDVARGWLLLGDGGPPLPDDDFAALGDMLTSYGALQRALSSHVDELLAVGVADMRPAAMPARFDEAFAVAERIGAPEDRSALDRIAGLRPEFDEWCARLAESPVPASIDHNDLHPGNIFASGPRFYDWGDAVVAHPFASMLVALGFLHLRHDLAVTDPAFVRLRDAYLEPFTDLAPRASLVADVELACQVGKVARALTWDRAVRPEGDAGKFARAPLETLLSLEADWFSLQA